MAKFVVLAREAFTDLVRSLGSRGSGFGPDVKKMLSSYQANRAKIVGYYKKATGKNVPEGKVVIPSKLHAALKQETFGKKMVQKTAKYQADEENWMRSLGREDLPPKGPGRHQNAKRSGRVRTTRDDGAPGTIRNIGEREFDQIARDSALRQERAAAKSGRKLNRTRFATRRTLEEDTF